MSENIRFENYELLRKPDGSAWELGRGAMGVTYKARDTDLHCDVALKVINPSILSTPEVRERFLREARAAAKLRHPNIATVFRLGVTEDGTHYYAMEFCDGQTLQQAIEAWGPLPAANAVHLAWQVSRALRIAEEHRLIHRDLKPATSSSSRRRTTASSLKSSISGWRKTLPAAINRFSAPLTALLARRTLRVPSRSTSKTSTFAPTSIRSARVSGSCSPHILPSKDPPRAS